MDRTLPILRAEGLALGIAATGFYASTDASWWLFAGLVFVPDAAMAGYVLGPRLGAAIYNTAHSTVPAFVLLAMGWLMESPLAVAAALVWLAHIGFDRALGYGLKLPEGFRHTHLGPVGKPAADHLRKQST